jgi:hypothetical protein
LAYSNHTNQRRGQFQPAHQVNRVTNPCNPFYSTLILFSTKSK